MNRKKRESEKKNVLWSGEEDIMVAQQDIRKLLIREK